MPDRVLIDTSVWVDFFRGNNDELAERISSLLKSGRAVYTGVIALELINGAKSRKEVSILYDAFDAMNCITVTDMTFLSAGRMGYELARKGYTLSTVDLLIAQVAIENDVSVMTHDEHFSTMARHSALKLLL
jgi:predicted nucleic acid-binding protein